MTYQNILFEVENNIALITINRPDKLNALNAETIQELSAAIDQVIESNEIKSAILTGAGKAFVAGADISEFPSMNAQAGEQLARVGADTLFNKIENCPKPFIAAVNGFALGGGCELAMACHFRIASEKAKFGQPEVNLGLIPGYGGTQRMTHLIGKGKSMEMHMTAHIADANEALQMGLVNHVTVPESLIEHCKNILGIINSKAPLALTGIINCINASNSEQGFEKEIKTFGSLFDSADKNEGVTAFLEKRTADFKGS